MIDTFTKLSPLPTPTHTPQNEVIFNLHRNIRHRSEIESREVQSPTKSKLMTSKWLLFQKVQKLTLVKFRSS